MSLISAFLGAIEFCLPHVSVDIDNVFEAYTTHRLLGTLLIGNAIICVAVKPVTDSKVKREFVQAFLFQSGLFLVVLLRPQAWGFLTFINYIALASSIVMCGMFGYLIFVMPQKISFKASSDDRMKKMQEKHQMEMEQITKERDDLKAKVSELHQAVSDSNKKATN